MGTRRRLPTMVGVLVVLTSLPFATPVAAAASLTTLGSPYTQNFNTLPVSGSATWTNDSSVPAWFTARSGSSPGTTIVANNGSSNAGNLYSYGTGTDTDRALGSIGSGNVAAGNFFYGVALVNNTGSTITQLDVTYTGEQWRMGGCTTTGCSSLSQTAAFSYLVGSPTVTGSLAEFQSAGVAVTQLDFVSPQFGPAAAVALDGNAAANRVTITHSITGLSIPVGTEVMLRWSDPDHSGSDHGLSIDDVSVTPQGGDSDVTLSLNDVSQDEGDSGTTSFTFTVSLSEAAEAGGVSFDIATADGTAQDDNPGAEDNDYVAKSLTSQTIPEGSSSYLFTVDVNGDATPEADETFFVNVSSVSGASVNDGQGLGTIVDDDTDVCDGAYTPIHDIQGNGASTPIPGNVVTEGIVVADFEQSTASTRGFYIQDPSPDADPATSEGILVFTGAETGTNLGDSVRVTGYARERFAMTTINGSNADASGVTDIEVCSTGNSLPLATAVNLPFASATEAERWEGMYVTLPQALVIAEYFNYDRFGEIVLALPLAGESRPFTGTAIDEPGAAANSRTAANLLRRITLDDNVSTQNPAVLRHPNGSPFSLTNYFRGGDTVANTTGILTYEFSLYRIQPTAAATYTAVNARPAAPTDTGGRVTVAVQNTLNFFLTLDTTASDTGPGPCGGNANLDCRGADADQPDEFDRQRAKLLATLIGLDADVIGLNELENTPGVEPLANIVDGLNAELGAGTYAYINTGTIGTDAIKVGIIYRPGVVTPLGAHAILNSSVDPRFIDTKSRPVLAQTFTENATGAVFTVAVNHLKSKGSACTDVADPDAGDGQGNCNGTRTLAAQALVDWLATDPTSSGDPDFLIIGDLNSYAMEDPIDAIKVGPDDVVGGGDDYTNLVHQFLGTYAYSYVFDGQNGYLDHALSSSSLTAQVTGVAEWHINADESDVLDYDTSFKPAGQDALYEAEAYRSSDHDGVIVGLDLAFDSPPEITSVTGTVKAVRVRSNRRFQANWTDADSSSFTTTWNWGDGSPDTVHTPSGTFESVVHKFPAAGFYHVTFTVTDDTGESDTESVLVIVWDRAAGYVTGSLTFPDGSLTQQPSVKYGSSGSPKGKVTVTVPGMTFVSKKLKWMVVDDDAATYSARGKVNGVGGYVIVVSLIDGGTPGTLDKIRVQISQSNGTVVFDSQPGDPIDAAPTLTGTGGNIIVH